MTDQTVGPVTQQQETVTIPCSTSREKGTVRYMSGPLVRILGPSHISLLLCIILFFLQNLKRTLKASHSDTLL